MKFKKIDEESNYEISKKGEIRNIETKHIKKQRFDSHGYYRVTLYPSGKTYSIHRLVAKTFLENKENKPQVNHIDGNKTNNSIENLEWCTPSENIQHAYDMGLAKVNSGEKNHFSIYKDIDIEKVIINIQKGLGNLEIKNLMRDKYNIEISDNAISDIRYRKRYKNVSDKIGYKKIIKSKKSRVNKRWYTPKQKYKIIKSIFENDYTKKTGRQLARELEISESILYPVKNKKMWVEEIERYIERSETSA